MQRVREAVYGLGRVSFGAALMTTPDRFGRLLVGDEASEPGVRIALRTYGTRDVVLGLGMLGALASGRDTAPWLAAGIASDLLDATAQAVEWSDLPPDKRVAGVLAALGTAGIGIELLRRAAD